MLLDLFLCAQELSKGESKALERNLLDYLDKHWSWNKWSAGDESIAHKVMSFYTRSGQRAAGLAWLESLQSAHPNQAIVTAHSLSPILQQSMLSEGRYAEGEELLTRHLVNHGRAFNRVVVDCLVSGVMQRGDMRDALDLAQELFNQHRVSPSFKLLVTMLYHWKRKGDVYEAKRVADFAGQMYGQGMLDKAVRGFRPVSPEMEYYSKEQDVGSEASLSLW
jgi:hypothetical protein